MISKNEKQKTFFLESLFSFILHLTTLNVLPNHHQMFLFLHYLFTCESECVKNIKRSTPVEWFDIVEEFQPLKILIFSVLISPEQNDYQP